MHAGVWTGTAASFVDIHPSGATDSEIRSSFGAQQVGRAAIGGANHAALWSGTASSYVDLHSVLGAGYTNSFAYGIWSNGSTTYVVGRAKVAPSGYYHAILWTSASDFVVPGQVTLECFAGFAGDGIGARNVTFSATDKTTFTNRTTQPLNFTNGVATYSLTVPYATSRVSAKTAWNLRQAQTVAFASSPVSANFFLPTGDLDDSNVVDIQDYFRVAAAWYTAAATADLDGNGLVDTDDYFLLANRWDQIGHEE